ncbi:MAG: DUF427 domain-containing protein [Coriobacteriia bacterium]|nr:DUF427 domain-containing protein [Coriobacteriia bacterium]
MHVHRVKPRPGQESVWEYPRPPLVQNEDRVIEIVFCGSTIVRTNRALRVLETGHAPVYYIPMEDVRAGTLIPADRVSYCEFKGEARYYHVVADDRRAQEAAWMYAKPRLGYEALVGHVAFYPTPMDRCLVGGEIGRPQSGIFRGGWVTPDVVGPFIGDPGALRVD